jgi:ferredoxin
MFYCAMSDRPASWRMPSPKQIEKLAAAVGRKAPAAPALGPKDDLPPEYWSAILDDTFADDGSKPAGPSTRALRLSEIYQHLLRVSCRRCGRCIEIRKVDATRLYGPAAIWREAAQRLLDDTCQQRTGRYEEDGCWPSFD